MAPPKHRRSVGETSDKPLLTYVGLVCLGGSRHLTGLPDPQSSPIDRSLADLRHTAARMCRLTVARPQLQSGRKPQPDLHLVSPVLLGFSSLDLTNVAL